LTDFLASGGSPLDHVVQHPLITCPADWGMLTPQGVITLFSNQIAMLILAGLLLIVFVPLWAMRRRGSSDIAAMVPAGFGNFIESICQYLRKEVAEPALGEHTDRFIKYI
jgi:F0F1-type ATP synthase membrane subunit a